VKPGSLVVAYLHPGDVAHSFHRSMRGLWQHDATHNRRLVGFVEQECGAGRITEGRNDAVAKFLRTEGEWLAFVDSDMGFDPDAFDRLIDAADPVDRPIVGGLAFGQRKVALGPAGSTRVQQFPTIFRWVQGPQLAGTVPIYNYPPDTLVECDATGGAFFIVHRSVLEHLAAEHAKPRQWFDEMRIDEQIFGEDLTFFHRCRQLGYPIHVHTGVQTSHRKAVYLTEETQPRQESIPNIVVIPMKDRLDLTMALVDQLAEQGEATAVLIYDNGSSQETLDQLKAWQRPTGLGQLAVFDASGQNIHQMWNRGLSMAAAGGQPCNVAVLNNDIKIGPNFLSGLARALRYDELAAVVSPNYDDRDPGGADCQVVRDICAGRYDGTGGIAGFAFMLKGEGGYRFPEELNWWYGDNDMMCAAAAAGMHGLIALGVTCEHIGGGSQTAGDWSQHSAQLEADRLWFVSKWHPTFDPDAVPEPAVADAC
jgi:GT2 family glycosyltransferase